VRAEGADRRGSYLRGRAFSRICDIAFGALLVTFISSFCCARALGLAIVCNRSRFSSSDSS